jgi:hypothetical protein
MQSRILPILHVLELLFVGYKQLNSAEVTHVTKRRGYEMPIHNSCCCLIGKLVV